MYQRPWFKVTGSVGGTDIGLVVILTVEHLSPGLQTCPLTSRNGTRPSLASRCGSRDTRPRWVVMEAQGCTFQCGSCPCGRCAVTREPGVRLPGPLQWSVNTVAGLQKITESTPCSLWRPAGQVLAGLRTPPPSSSPRPRCPWRGDASLPPLPVFTWLLHPRICLSVSLSLHQPLSSTDAWRGGGTHRA